MQCPSCQMNVKDGAQFCIYCGTHFNNQPAAPVQSAGATCPKCNTILAPGAQFCTNCGAQLAATQAPVQTNAPMTAAPVSGVTNTPMAAAAVPGATNASMTPDQVLQQNQQKLVDEQNERDKYLRAYFGSSYDRVMGSSFSFGTFFFEWLWLIIYKLYGAAGRLFLTQIGINVVANIVALLLGKGIGSLLGSIANLYIVIMYAKEFSSAYIDRANHEINDILKTYQNEDERIRACKAAGGPSIVGIIIVFAIIGLFVFAFISLVASVGRSMDNSRKDTFADTSKAYVNAVKNAVMVDELKCGKNISEVDPGIYYYGFTTAEGFSAEDLTDVRQASSWNNADVAGQVIIHKQTYSGRSSYRYAIVLVDAEGRGIGTFDSNGRVLSAVPEISIGRSVVKASDGDNRKKYFDKASAGTLEAFSSVGPTLDTKMGETPLKDLYGSDTESVTKAPVACELIK